MSDNYRELYEAERNRNREYAMRIARLEEENASLSFRLDRIHNNPLWKHTKGIRDTMLRVGKLKKRIKNLGGFRGFVSKVLYKIREAKAKKGYGKRSFPNAERRRYEENYEFAYRPLISILVPLYNTPAGYMKQMLESVKYQTYSGWELVLADGSDDAHSYVGEYFTAQAANDNRIKYRKLKENLGISGNTNECVADATGDYLALFDHDDILHPSLLFEYVLAINEKGADYLYCDETTFKGNNIDKMITMHFKPDFAIDNLRANNYICHFSCFKRELLEGTELFRTEFDGSQDHDMILRLTDRARNIVHVPKLLYYWRSHAGSVAKDIGAKSYAIEAAKGAVADHLSSKGFENFTISSTRAFETIFRIDYELVGHPKISIIIANKDHKDDLSRCIDSILSRSTYDNYEIVIVDNNSTTKEIEEYYRSIKDSRVKLIRYIGEFNYSRVNNYGVEYADGQYVVLLNNDTAVITPNWMEQMLMYAQRKDVGAVGAKLLYADRTIQHAGVVIGLGAHRAAGHTHYGKSYDNLGYMGRLCYAQDVTAVTGACLMVAKHLYTKHAGLDDHFAVSLNDVDFCLRLRKQGLLNVFTPFAELYHYESKSRGLDTDGSNAKRYEKETQLFKKKWEAELKAGDPYFNPNFSLDRSDYSVRIC